MNSKKLSLNKETLRLLSNEIESVHGGRPKNTDSLKCADNSVSVCVTDCGCKWVLSNAASC